MIKQYFIHIVWGWLLLSGCAINNATQNQQSQRNSVIPCYDLQRDLSQPVDSTVVYWCGASRQGALPQGVVYLNADGTLHNGSRVNYPPHTEH